MKSEDAPVVTASGPKMISSATRPPSATDICIDNTNGVSSGTFHGMENTHWSDAVKMKSPQQKIDEELMVVSTIE